jgi:predicted amidohydrolase
MRDMRLSFTGKSPADGIGCGGFGWAACDQERRAMKVALAQWTSGHDVDANLDQMSRYARTAANAGAAMLFMPEFSVCLTTNPHPFIAARAADVLIRLSAMARAAAAGR